MLLNELDLALDDDELRILWAAFEAMVQDNHAPQDNLSIEQWELAWKMEAALDSEENRRSRLRQ